MELIFLAAGLMMGLAAIGAAIIVMGLVDAIPMIGVGLGMYLMFAVAG